jgi:DNA repair protein RadC
MPVIIESCANRRTVLRGKLRERFRRLGLQSFKDSEALGILLTYGIHRKKVKPIVKQLIYEYGDFRGVLDAPVEELAAFPGLDEYSATLIKLAKESSEFYLKKRATFAPNGESGYLDTIKYLRVSMAGLKVEQFRVLYRDTHQNLLGVDTISEGTVDKSIVQPRKVMEGALRRNAVALMFAHNHPSGIAAPSRSDKEVTRTLVEAAKIMDMEVSDHIIITKNGFFSFRDAGLL